MYFTIAVLCLIDLTEIHILCLSLFTIYNCSLIKPPHQHRASASWRASLPVCTTCHFIVYTIFLLVRRKIKNKKALHLNLDKVNNAIRGNWLFSAYHSGVFPVVLSDPAMAPIGKNVLTLTNVEQSENFTCVAVSKLGNIEATTLVEVKGTLHGKPPQIFFCLFSMTDPRSSPSTASSL